MEGGGDSLVTHVRHRMLCHDCCIADTQPAPRLRIEGGSLWREGPTRLVLQLHICLYVQTYGDGIGREAVLTEAMCRAMYSVQIRIEKVRVS